MTKSEAIALLESGNELTNEQRAEIAQAIKDNVPSYETWESSDEDEWESSQKCW